MITAASSPAGVLLLCWHSASLYVCARPALPRRTQVLKRLPNLKKLDGIPVDVDERDQAIQARGGGA